MSVANRQEELSLLRRPDTPVPARQRLRGSGTVARRAWRHAYVRRLVVFDAASALVAGVAAHLIRWRPTHAGTTSLVIACLLPFVWVLAMPVARSYEERFLWVGPEEFRRVFFAACLLLAALGTVSWAFQLEVARGFVVLALPLATVLTLVQRQAERGWLRHQRDERPPPADHAAGRPPQRGRGAGPAVGPAAHSRLPRHRLLPARRPASPDGDAFNGLPVLGGLERRRRGRPRATRSTRSRCCPARSSTGAALRRLGWELEKTRAELLLAPAVTEIVGPRVRIRPVCGLSLMHMERPRAPAACAGSRRPRSTAPAAAVSSSRPAGPAGSRAWSSRSRSPGPVLLPPGAGRPRRTDLLRC